MAAVDSTFVKIAAASAGLVGLGVAFGFGIARWQEAKRHALDFVEEELGDAVSKDTALYVDEHSTKPHAHRHGSAGPSQLLKITGNLPTASRVDECEDDANSSAVASGASTSAAAATSGAASAPTLAAHVPIVPSPTETALVSPTSASSCSASVASGSAASSPAVHAARAASLANRAPSVDLGAAHHRRGGPVIIGVAGASGSGKTSIAELIAARLTGQRVLSISSDNYYKSLGPGVESGDYNFDHPAAIDFDLLADQLEHLRRGEDVEVPNYDFVHHRRTDKTTHVTGSAVSVVIIDGIFVLWAERVRQQCDIRVFCSEDLDVCLARRLRRDLVERGRTVESVLRQYVRFVKPGFQQFIAPSMAHADLIVPRARDNHVAISMLARDIQRRADDAAAAGPSHAQSAPVASPASGATGGAAATAFAPTAAAPAPASSATSVVPAASS